MSCFCIRKSHSHFFSKNICEVDRLSRTVNILTTNELVKLTMLWITGPRAFCMKPKCLILSYVFSSWLTSTSLFHFQQVNIVHEMYMYEAIIKGKLPNIAKYKFTWRSAGWIEGTRIHFCMFSTILTRETTFVTSCLLFFFFLFGFCGPFKNISHIEAIVHQRWAKTGEPGEKPPDNR